MAVNKILPPSASSLSASIRDLGYSLETAVADLIDNSITANATQARIFCDLASPTTSLVIIDNGCGMDKEHLLAAMKIGSLNPKYERSPNDLGRFGLGLKTSSFSQCKKLTVLTRQSGKSHAAEWNLDLVDQKDEWLISILDDKEIQMLPFVEEFIGDGTIIIWRNLDRLFEDEIGERRNEIVNSKLDMLGKHLALVFHRYLSGEIKNHRISISINGDPIEAFDPFCQSNGATQKMPKEIVDFNGARIEMQPFILPHHSKLTAVEYDFYQDRSEFISNQGAYIYRNGRLIAWGDWFRIIPKGEATKLARVQIDFTNNLDYDWVIDIKKSRARPPYLVRERLKQIIDKISNRSQVVHKGRGQKLFNEIKLPFWERHADQGIIKYSLNMEHPLVQSILDMLDEEKQKQFNLFAETVASSLPIGMIYSDYSTSPKDFDSCEISDDIIFERLYLLKAMVFGDGKFNAEKFIDIARSTRFFKDDILNKFAKENST